MWGALDNILTFNYDHRLYKLLVDHDRFKCALYKIAIVVDPF